MAVNDTTTHPSNLDLALRWVADYARPSEAGKGGDDALFNAACMLYHGFDLGDGALTALRAYNATKCAPAWNETRLAYKLAQAKGAAYKHKPGGLARWMLRKLGYVAAWQPRGGNDKALGALQVAVEPVAHEVKRCKFDLALLQREVADVSHSINAEWFKERSPVPVENCDAAAFLARLFRPGEVVIIFDEFYSQGQYVYWVGKGSFRLARRPGVKGVRSPLPVTGRKGIWYLCQPVTGKWLPNPRALDEHGRPKLSRRSEEVVTAWRYMVLESDNAPSDLWLRLLAKLPMPIAAIYTSGGRSIHALVRVGAKTKPQWDGWKKMVVGLLSALGADPGALTAVRLTRLPGCMREGGEDENGKYFRYGKPRLQELLYLNPSPPVEGIAILDGGNVCE